MTNRARHEPVDDNDERDEVGLLSCNFFHESAALELEDSFKGNGGDDDDESVVAPVSDTRSAFSLSVIISTSCAKGCASSIGNGEKGADSNGSIFDRVVVSEHLLVDYFLVNLYRRPSVPRYITAGCVVFFRSTFFPRPPPPAPPVRYSTDSTRLKFGSVAKTIRIVWNGRPTTVVSFDIDHGSRNTAY